MRIRTIAAVVIACLGGSTLAFAAPVTKDDAVAMVNNEIFELGADGARGKEMGMVLVSVNGLKVAAHNSGLAQGEIAFEKPKLWSIEQPNRYVVVTSILQDGKLVDRCETPFGIRTIEFTATNGFLLNGKRVPINEIGRASYRERV